MIKKISLNSSRNDVKKGKPSLVTIFIFVLLIVYCLVLILPVIWSLIVSFMDYNDYFLFFNLKAFNAVKFKIDFSNFTYAWKNLTVTSPTTEQNVNIPTMFGYSLIYSLGCAATFTICPAIVAYATARFKYAFSKVVYAFVIIAMSLPIVGSMASEITMLRNLHIDNTFFAMFVLRFNFLSIYFLILHAQFSSIPMDYTEAAKVDGASNFRVMWQVVMPQALNTIVIVFILSFISYWNDYQIPLLYLPKYPTAAYAIYDFVHNAKPDAAFTARQLAATILMALPIVVVFIVFNRKLRVSVAMGGIKS